MSKKYKTYYIIVVDGQEEIYSTAAKAQAIFSMYKVSGRVVSLNIQKMKKK